MALWYWRCILGRTTIGAGSGAGGAASGWKVDKGISPAGIKVEVRVRRDPWRGQFRRPLPECAALACVFVAKADFNFLTTCLLVQILSSGATLRRLRGSHCLGKVTGEASFPRAFSVFVASSLPSPPHVAMLQENHANC